MAQAQEVKIRQKLAELGGVSYKKDDVLKEGSRYVLPTRTTLEQDIAFLTKYHKNLSEPMRFQRIFRVRPLDGAVSAHRALEKLGGLVGMEATVGFFGMKNPPQMISVPIGPKDTVQVPWGLTTTPVLPGAEIHFHAVHDEDVGPLFGVLVECERRYAKEVEGLFNLIQTEVDAESIYRGQAIDGRDTPQFLDLSTFDPDKVVYSDSVLKQLEALVWNLPRHADLLRKKGLPLKRAVLFEGPYGTGKTLGAYLTAKEAVDNGWTFIFNRPGRDNIHLSFQTAMLYQPAVVFVEDVDSLPGNQDRDAVSLLLDTFDGFAGKGAEILCVLTTNHPERIHPGMVRPGRLDAVIHIDKLDQAGVEKLVRVSLPAEQLDTVIDWDAVYEACKEYQPAFVKEVIDRAYLYSLSSGNPTIGTRELIEAADGLRPQLELMKGNKEPDAPDALTIAFRRATLQSAEDALEHAGAYDEWDGRRVTPSSNGRGH